jgi:hypothetical protein
MCLFGNSLRHIRSEFPCNFSAHTGLEFKNMRRRFLFGYTTVYFSVLIVGWFLWSYPDWMIVILMLTFGLGIPLFFAPALAFYMTFLWPAVVLYSGFGWRRFAGIVAVITLLTVSLVPPFRAGIKARDFGSQNATTEVSKTLSSMPTVLELVVPLNFYGGPDDMLRNAPCDAFCQRLLLSGAVRAVQVSTTQGTSKKISVVYRIQQNQSCPKAFGDGSIVLPETQDAASRGQCIYAKKVTGSQPSVRIEKTVELNDTDDKHLFFVPKRSTTYTVSEYYNGSWRRRSKFVEYETEVLSYPLLPLFVGTGGLSMKSGWWRHDVVLNPVSPERVLEVSTKQKLKELPKVAMEPPVAFVKRVLSRPGSEPFGEEILVPIRNYLNTLRPRQTLSAEDKAIVQQLLGDRRFSGMAFLLSALEAEPELVIPLIPGLLNRLAVPIDESKGHDHNAIGWLIARAPIESVRPFSGQIIRIAESSDQWHVSPLLVVAGRLDADASDLLIRRLKAESWTVRGAAVNGICSADAALKARLLPELKAILAIYGGKHYGGNEDLELALTGLKNGGFEAEVESYLKLNEESDAKRLSYAMTRLKC